MIRLSELILEINGSLYATQVCRNSEQILTTQEQWKKAMIEKLELTDMPDAPPSSPFGKLVAICLLVTVCTNGCTSMRPVRGVNSPAPPQGFLDIKPGDRVAVEMKDGRQERFRVQSIDGDTLMSPSGQRYARTEMLQLRRQQLSHAKTWPLVGVAVFFGVALISALAYYN